MNEDWRFGVALPLEQRGFHEKLDQYLLSDVCDLALMSQGFADVYYVAQDGLDSNDGTETSPFATIQKAVDAAVTGSTIYVGPGEYTSTNANIISIPNGKSLWFIGDAEDPSRVVIDGEDERSGLLKKFSVGDELTMKGFTFTQ